jgi:methyltransferase
MSSVLFVVLVLLVGVERLAELVVSKKHLAWSAERGGREFGSGHYPAMVLLHTAFLVGAIVEVLVAGRPFQPWLGWPMLAVLAAGQLLRWWCIRSLGNYWNTRVVVIPGAPLVTAGPYRWLAHPNYVAVVAEGIALPLVHSAWITATVFTVLNAWLLTVRIRTENDALRQLATA